MRRPILVLLTVNLAVILLAPGGTMAYQATSPCRLELILLEQVRCHGCLTDEPEASDETAAEASKGPSHDGESSLEVLRRGVALLRFVVCVVEELVEETFKGQEKR